MHNHTIEARKGLLCASEEPVASSLIVAADRYIHLIRLCRGHSVRAHPDGIIKELDQSFIFYLNLTTYPVLQAAQ